jgi:general secretion pathway protein A
MYRRFYNLQRNPFEITPDPSFLFPTQRHNEALAALYYGVRRRKGFVVLTGEVGTGKTLLVRCLLQVLKGSDVAYAYIFNSRLSPFDFLQYTAGDLGLTAAGKTKSELLLSLSNFLIARHQKKLTTVLVVDEAHHLSPEVLEEIRLLTNLETAQEKLLQILLVGQPELDEKLDSLDLRQLKQRIALRSQLRSLDREETGGYVQRRLELAGADPKSDPIFPTETIADVFRHSRGIPRLINTICENALITGYARQARHITPQIINGVAADFRMGLVHTPPKPKQGSPELLEAVQTLLDLHEYLVGMRTKEQELPLAVSSGASKHEPYI